MTAKNLKVLDEALFFEFQSQTIEDLNDLEKATLKLKDTQDFQPVIEDFFRKIHTLKGSAAYLALHDTKDFAHHFEELLDSLRRDSKSHRILREKNTIDVFLASIDYLKELVQSHDFKSEQQVPRSAQFDLLSQKLIQLAQGLKGTTQATSPQSLEENRVTPPFLKQQIERLERFLTAGLTEPAMVARCLQLIHKFTVQNSWCREDHQTYLLETSERFVTMSSEDSKTTLTSIIKGLKENQWPELLPSDSSSLRTAMKEVKENSESTSSAVEKRTVRVEESLIDDLMNLAGELIVARNSLSHWQMNLPAGVVEESREKQLKEITHRLGHVASELQSGVSKARWVPIGSLFNRFHRMVRDLAQTTQKSLRLTTTGDEVGIDKLLIDQLNEPLIHLVRNAADHGIESDATRLQAGKQPEGQIELKAIRKGGLVRLEVTDDGKGLDVEKIRTLALQKKLVSEEKLRSMTQQELFQLIFLPGFSTATEVTQLSGRGVGMDSVLHALKKMGGEVSVESQYGKGTQVILEFPVGLAVTEALLVEVGQSTFGIPLRSVLEITKLKSQSISQFGHQSMVQIRGEVIRVQDLAAELQEQPQNSHSEGERDQLSLIVQINSERRALVVDRVVRKEEIVIKSLNKETSTHPAVTGAAVMGDGSALLVIDPVYL